MDKGIYIFQLFLSSCSTDGSISQVTGCNLWYTILYVGNAIVLIDNANADELAPCLMGSPSNFITLAISLVPMTCWPVDLLQLRKLTLIVGCAICAVDIAKAVSESSGIICRDDVLVGAPGWNSKKKKMFDFIIFCFYHYLHKILHHSQQGHYKKYISEPSRFCVFVCFGAFWPVQCYKVLVKSQKIVRNYFLSIIIISSELSDQ